MPWARRSLIGGYLEGIEGEMILTGMLINLREYLTLKNGEQYENPNSDSSV